MPPKTLTTDTVLPYPTNVNELDMPKNNPTAGLLSLSTVGIWAR